MGLLRSGTEGAADDIVDEGGRLSWDVGLDGPLLWRVRAGDEASRPVVEDLAAVMRLEPTGTAHSREAGSGAGQGEGKPPRLGPAPRRIGPPREVVVVVEEGPRRRDREDLPRQGTLTVAVAPPDSPSMRTIAMMRVGDVLVRDAQRRGAVLVHGTLAERDGVGVLLAGTSQIGKSTAARRLPLPWRALSDDAALVVPDGRGGYRAHPWPTWSRFFDGEDEVGDEHARWDVAMSVPLAAVFVLSQADEDRVEPVEHAAQSTALLIDCVEAVSRGLARDLRVAAARTVRLEQVANVEALVAAVPVFHLALSRDGQFWRLLERTLEQVAGGAAPAGGGEGEARQEAGVPGLDTSGTFVYTGPSMNPTLSEPQLLETEEVAGTPISVGDVVCFRSPRDGVTVVHRVVEVGPQGIRTRGDRNPDVDPWMLQSEDFLGRVVRTRRGEATGGVSGGQKGLLIAASGRLRLSVGRAVRRGLRGVYRGLAASGVPARVWSCVAPASCEQRIVRFGTGPLAEHRLYVGERPVGRYDRRLRRWVVDHPYRLIIDASEPPEPPSTPPSPRVRVVRGERREDDDG